MAFEIKIKNIGKLTDAKIRIGQFTVFAGPNNTGKSFVSKILYSIFDAMNANHAVVRINNLTKPINYSLNRLMRWDIQGEDSPLNLMSDSIKDLETLVRNLPVGDTEKLDEIIPELVGRSINIRSMFLSVRSSMERAIESNESRFPRSLVRRALEDVDQALIELERALQGVDAQEFITSGIAHKITENLIQNFQVSDPLTLKGEEDEMSEVDVAGFAKFQFTNEDVEFNVPHEWVQQLQQISEVIYLESPVYWKLKNALEDMRIDFNYTRRRRQKLTGVPGYFYDLVSRLKSEYTGDIAFPNLYEKLTGNDVLGGKIAISENGDLSFQEDNRSYPLPVTAMGVANLGILALLIERKVLDRDSFLFIDEPEAHLHPAWQVVMAEALFELAKGGVNVVIATHSADILKWLEVHVKKNPEYEEMIALNKFPVVGDEVARQDFGDKIAVIKQELTKPFADLYMSGL